MPKSLPEQIKDSAQAPAQLHERPVAFGQVVSTGSLLLDLAISGGVTPRGGLPGRIIVQVYGPNSTGKTTLMAEVLGHVQRAGGAYRVRDPEARLNAAYCKTFGVKLNQDEIERTGTITDMFEGLIGPLITKTKQDIETGVEKEGKTKRDKKKAWEPNPAKINFYAVDSLAALASKMEMEQGDKMGKKRAKDFSEGFRQISDHIYNHNIIMFCTDQLRDTDYGQKTSGGNAIGYYASLRIGLKKIKDLTKEICLPEVEKGKGDIVCYGIEVEAFIAKPVANRPFIKVPLRLIFNYGYDDIGANLQWLKSHGAMGPDPGYRVGDSYFPANTKGGALDAAIAYVEDEGLEEAVQEAVIDLWQEIEDQVRPNRKPKER